MRMGKCKSRHQVSDMACLRHRCLQELPSGRGIIKQLPYDKGGPVRSTGIFQILFFSACDTV